MLPCVLGVPATRHEILYGSLSTVPAKGGGSPVSGSAPWFYLFFLRLLLCAQRSYLEPRDIPFCRPSTAYSPGRALYRALRGSVAGVGGREGVGRGGSGG